MMKKAVPTRDQTVKGRLTELAMFSRISDKKGGDCQVEHRWSAKTSSCQIPKALRKLGEDGLLERFLPMSEGSKRGVTYKWRVT
ncbi:MAG: hypothetical protein HW403_537 [Dehalococcoidia bacterium]|nr:hypothetical protein [Dehalococcoidia bacterium]